MGLSPRVGGTGLIALVRQTGVGLSPRVRGNRDPSSPQEASARSIPACAGEPSALAITGASIRVYPRVCGGTVGLAITTLGGDGLSPRVRGNRDDRRSRGGRDGSIPACAGEPTPSRRWRRRGRVYPRVCGGTAKTQRPVFGIEGLSPRVRGNQHILGGGAGNQRSIPACAGEPVCPRNVA